MDQRNDYEDLNIAFDVCHGHETRFGNEIGVSKNLFSHLVRFGSRAFRACL